MLDGIGLDLWLVGQGVPEIPNATVFSLPDYPEILSPLLAVVPMQMLAYEMAVLKNLNPDTFRRDDDTFKNRAGCAHALARIIHEGWWRSRSKARHHPSLG